VEILDPTGFSAAFENLRGRTSYVKLAADLSILSRGELSPDPSTLQRLGSGRWTNTRLIDSIDKAKLFQLAMTLHALADRTELATPSIVAETRRMCLALLGPEWSPRYIAELESKATVLSRMDFARFVRAMIDDD